jgi:hypothetical protein
MFTSTYVLESGAAPEENNTFSLLALALASLRLAFSP